MVDKVFDRSNALYVKTVPQKGRGVFANICFKVGDVIDRAPTWGFDDATAKLLDRTGVLEYYFVRRDQPKGNALTGYVVFGWSSLMNHSSNPNAQRVWTDEESGAWVSIVAIKDIEVDEEVTHRYINMSAYSDIIDFID
ncbi:SET domain-containing protein-lysine N-methyltransferase [Bradyrhizobium yuanmingense]|uniref:SET domain-containing protein-lysine N-methyltransferase n=1 Tax=Bradyrhizobium yuanmingense TaxID=108015 RepID=UPI000FE351F3|nr:SET domain-containing protein-lysine N-methyltransferase [Bradyrhizobium yuanmingense]TGN72927.1 SET domain-containing protein-lysine N-methyltransferase [Bradyrhizobium yuanmingense]